MSIVNQAELYERLWAAEKVRLDLKQHHRELIESVLHYTGMSQRELARKIGVTHAHVSMVKTGKVGLTLGVARKLLNVLEGVKS